MGITLDALTKIISITTPTTSVTIQELVDAVRDWEDELCNMTYKKVIDAVGKADLGGSVSTGIVVSLNAEWQVQFWGGSGTTKVSGGTLVGGVGDEPVLATGTAGDLTILQNPVNSTIVSGGGTAPTVEEIRAEMEGAGTKLTLVKDNTDTIPAMDNKVDAILLDTGTDGVAISVSVAQEIADEILKRSISHTEDTADPHSLTSIILATLESSLSGATWTIKKRDGSPFTIKTVTTDAMADPITGVT